MDAAAIWWYTKVASNQVSVIQREFEGLRRAEFIPIDSFRRNRGKIKGVKQKCSVAARVNELRTVGMKFLDMKDGEKIYRFSCILKKIFRLEGMEGDKWNVEAAIKHGMDFLMITIKLECSRMYEILILREAPELLV